jgi:hypothetical protein
MMRMILGGVLVCAVITMHWDIVKIVSNRDLNIIQLLFWFGGNYWGISH